MRVVPVITIIIVKHAIDHEYLGHEKHTQSLVPAESCVSSRHGARSRWPPGLPSLSVGPSGTVSRSKPGRAVTLSLVRSEFFVTRAHERDAS